MAILQGALLSTQPARTHWSFRLAGFVVLIHVLNPQEVAANAIPCREDCPLGCP